MKKVMVFTRFERFWHWAQALLIISLMITGFEVHGTYHWLGFQTAAEWHTVLAWSLIVLWVFAIFWHFTTGAWRQYLPTTDKLGAVVRYYTLGIFRKGVEHPYKKTTQAKHNPLQRLAYLVLKLAISPVVWISGLLYLFYNDWSALGLQGLDVGTVAVIHTAAAFAMLIFFIGHVYMSAFTAKPPMAYLKPMITGYEDAEQ